MLLAAFFAQKIKKNNVFEAKTCWKMGFTILTYCDIIITCTNSLFCKHIGKKEVVDISNNAACSSVIAANGHFARQLPRFQRSAKKYAALAKPLFPRLKFYSARLSPCEARYRLGEG